MTPEGRIKILAKSMLASLRIAYVFMPVQRGFGPAGLDFYCCINGRFVAIETKVPKAKLKPRQIFTANDIAAAGGLVCVIRDKEDVQVARELICKPTYNMVFDRLGTQDMYGEYLWFPL